jgi:hypothetical protein
MNHPISVLMANLRNALHDVAWVGGAGAICGPRRNS